MPIILQAFFFDFLRKTRKRGSYQHHRRPSRAGKRHRLPRFSKMAKFGEFQSFNVFKQRITSTYQQTINYRELTGRPRQHLSNYFCNIIFTIKNFTFSLHSGRKGVTENNTGTHNPLLLHFLQA